MIVELTALPRNPLALPVGILGFSRSRWGAHSLPLDLGAAGMPGCRLFINIAALHPLLNNIGRAPWTLSIPNSANLMGGKFYQQALVLDPPANALGVVMTNAGEGTVGG